MSSMLRWMSSVGDTAYKTASKTGLTAGSEQPPYPCALPLRVLHDVTDVAYVEGLLDDTFAGVQDMLHDMRQLNESLSSSRKTWKLLDMTDPDGDLRLYTRTHVGPYNFAKATLSLAGVPPQLVLMCMHTQDYHARRRYSDHLREYTVLARNPRLPREFVGNDDRRLDELAACGVRDWFVEYNYMYAPPPISSRDLVFLVEKRYVAAEDCYYIYGCSVDYVPYRKHNTSCVRAIAMWGWQLTPVSGNSTLATYVTCMNPNGWTPTFIVSWMQMTIAKELRCSRALLYEDSKRMAAVVQSIVQQQRQQQQQQQQLQQQQQHKPPLSQQKSQQQQQQQSKSSSKAAWVPVSSKSSRVNGSSHHMSSSSYCSSGGSSNVTSSYTVDNDDVVDGDDPGAIAVAALYTRNGARHANAPRTTSPRVAMTQHDVHAQRRGSDGSSSSGGASNSRSSNNNDDNSVSGSAIAATATTATTLDALSVEDTRCYADDEEPLFSLHS